MSINCPEDCYYRVRRVLRDNSWTFPGIVWNIILSLPLSLYFSVTGDIYILHLLYSSLVAQTVKNLPAMLETWVWSLSQEDPLEKGIPTPVFLPREFCRQRSLAGYSLLYLLLFMSYFAKAS